MRIEILDDAQEDPAIGFHFYEAQGTSLGSYFLGSHRCLAKRFPFAIYYRVENKVIRVRAIIDCRRDPALIRKRLRQKQGSPASP